MVTLRHMDPFTHDAYRERYAKDEDFKVVFQELNGQIHVEDGDNKVDCYLYNGLLYRLNKLCVPKGESLKLTREA